MSPNYRRNHYVPVWYQKRFIPDDSHDTELHYLDLKPNSIRIPSGVHIQDRPHRWGPKKCFFQDDLYTLFADADQSTLIEEHFFGPIDERGKQAVELLTESDHFGIVNGQDRFSGMTDYLGAQKFRTPKGLDWLKNMAKTTSRDELLTLMVQFRQLHSAHWMESIWQIADATNCDTHFIISDHPVTAYNRRCGPRSQWCRGPNDPEVWLNATHTLFPLSATKILILTNRSWAVNPYQRETDPRPNPNPFRAALMNLLDIQLYRHLNEEEVRQINFIIKSRAFRHIAAGQKDWLYPEAYVSKSDWATFGDGLLLMPDPRALAAGGQVAMGFGDGSSAAVDAYGRPSYDPDYAVEADDDLEFIALQRFQGEFARRFGIRRRGRSSSFGATLDPEVDSESLHRIHLDQEKPYKWKMQGRPRNRRSNVGTDYKRR